MAPVELARGADQLAEGAPRPQLLEVDRAASVVTADEEGDRSRTATTIVAIAASRTSRRG